MMTRILAALTALLGLQALRAFLPLLVYVLRDRFGCPTPLLGAAALAFFALAGAAPILVRRFGPQRALATAVAALAFWRALLQLWPGDPWVQLLVAALAVQAFLLAIAAVSRAPSGSRGWCAGPVAPFLFGALVDATIHALAGTRDLHWSSGLAGASGLVPCLVAAALAVRTLATHGNASSTPAGEEVTGNDISGRFGALAWGPFLALHLEWFGNVARLSARAALDTAPAGQLLVLGLATGFALACRISQARESLLDRTAPAVAGLALLLSSLRVTTTGPSALPVLWVAQGAGAILLARALAAPARGGARPRSPSWDLAYGGGLALFLLLLFAHYGGYDIPLPLGKTGVHVLAAVLLTGVALRRGHRPRAAATTNPTQQSRLVRPGGQPLFLLCWATAILLAFLPGLRKPTPGGITIVPATDPTSSAKIPHPAPRQAETDRLSTERILGAGEDGRFRVISFNLHNGFDDRGGFGFDSMMTQLETQNPDVIALQEVSRGWVINGCVDFLTLAREALAIHAVSGPTVDSDWGNAVFTRIPPATVRNLALPPASLSLTRAVTVVEIPWAVPRGQGANEAPPARVRVLATHFHHRNAEGEVREQQARTVVEALPPGGADVLLGDFNALPDSEPMRALARAGWQDVGGSHPSRAEALTNPSREPVRRIDTILFRGSLHLLVTAVAPPWGSDHRAVIADFAPAFSAGTPAPASEPDLR